MSDVFVDSVGFVNDPQRKRLHEILVGSEFFKPENFDSHGEKLALLLNQECSVLLGHVMLDVLEEAGFSPEDIDGIGAKMPLSALMASSISHAASSRGQELDAFTYLTPQVVDGRLVTKVVSSFALDGAGVVLLVSPSDSPEEVMRVIEGLENGGTQVKALLSLVSHSQHDIEFFESTSLLYLYVF